MTPPGLTPRAANDGGSKQQSVPEVRYRRLSNPPPGVNRLSFTLKPTETSQTPVPLTLDPFKGQSQGL